MKLVFTLFFIFLIVVPFTNAAHYIIGMVNNASDGTDANGKTVILWKTSYGIADNVTDIVGPGGNSGSDNTYMIDCEMLQSSCDVGQEVAVKVIDNGDGYVSGNKTLTVSGAGFDVAGELKLNSPPNSLLSGPVNNSNISSPAIFNCTASDLDSNLKNITLYGNWSGGWHANETRAISGGYNSTIFTKNLPEGNYLWGCRVYDDLDISRFEGNYTLHIDNTPPNITAVYGNASEICSGSMARIYCNVSDIRLQDVVIQAWNASNFQANYTATFLAGSYYADIVLNSGGEWNFGCWANDSAGNYANKSGSSLIAHAQAADVIIENISFSVIMPAENEDVQINATLKNNGCTATGNFLVGFFRGDPDFGGEQINNNASASLGILERTIVNVSWNAVIGNNSIFAYADRGNSVIESNETNNKNNLIIDVPSWMYLYGDTDLNKVLANDLFSNLSYWGNQSNIIGNIFISDMENNISWGNLQAIGRNSTGGAASNDFSDIDILMGMQGFNDSISNVYTDGGAIRLKKNFTIYQSIITDVPIINSTNNSYFYTGILWDTSDDSNGEYDVSDKEDLVFVGEVNAGEQGAYGIYDYEIRFPAKLRSYREPDLQDVYLYYELH